MLLVLIDDLGFAGTSAFGGPVPTPTFDRIASEGLRYNNFHTTAVCSPTRAALKSGRNHHVNNMGAIIEMGTAFPGNTGQIPSDVAPAGKEPRFVLTAIPSRFNLDLRTPTGVGAMRAFIEGDFAGDGRLFRLRHAYGQWKSLVIGQTWSTFADPEAEPDGIDFEGLNAIALFRQPLVRWTKPLGARFSLAAAVENPAPDITNAKGVSQVPDIVVRARWRPAEGRSKGPFGLMNVFRQDAHVNVALLVRQIRGEPLDQPNTTLSTTGFGVGLSGRLTVSVAGGQGPGHRSRPTPAAASAATSPTSGRSAARTPTTTPRRTRSTRCPSSPGTSDTRGAGTRSCARRSRTAPWS